jgi:hypothetical protein
LSWIQQASSNPKQSFSPKLTHKSS